MIRAILMVCVLAALSSCELFQKADDTVQSAKIPVAQATQGIDTIAGYVDQLGKLNAKAKQAVDELRAAVVAADVNHDGVVQGWAETPLLVAAVFKFGYRLLEDGD